MCIDRDPSCADCPDQDGIVSDPVVLISATLYLMSCHASAPCPRLADMISRHLGLLSGTVTVPAVMRATCRELSKKWDRLTQTGCTATSTGTFIGGPSLSH
ncbi:MAG: hypothetical protein JNN20_19780 [Betaproteobacteria bacterium]|nr:hypothetical protein [Betaproteobacteria bacterium]